MSFFVMLEEDIEALKSYVAGSTSWPPVAPAKPVAKPSVVETQIQSVPYSSMKSIEEYTQDARRIVMRTFTTWPRCERHNVDHKIFMDTVGGIFRTYLRCPKC